MQSSSCIAVILQLTW